MKTSIKLKFRPSVKLDKEGTLYYQLIFNRRVKHLNTPYKIKQSEWDDKNGCIIFSNVDPIRNHQLESIVRCVRWDIQRLENIVDEYVEEALSLEDVEKRTIMLALERNKGKRRNAAKELNISERTLYRKIKEYGIE
jgi:transcriptional regulator with PAS, ATPase and Fis domain